MCHNSCMNFGIRNLSREEIKGKQIIDIGARYINGSYKTFIIQMNPYKYVGVDICSNDYVDVICNAENIIERFGKESFDIVISTEMLEHAENWKKVVSNIKNICKINGIILITTRSFGFPIHDYPSDLWRYELDDMKNIFSDCRIVVIEKDLELPGVFIKVMKPDNFVEKDLSNYELYNIVHNKKMASK